MEIPYTVNPRPDTGIANPKLGIWLFLASEIMLFGGLFSCYLFMRMGSPEGWWPQGWLNVPVGAANTAVLIISSVTVILAWVSLKMRKLNLYLLWMGVTIGCGLLFLAVKLAYEWPEKFSHFGLYLKDEPAILEKHEGILGNNYVQKEVNPTRVAKGWEPLHKRLHVAGHLYDPKHAGHGAHGDHGDIAHEIEVLTKGKPDDYYIFTELDSINGKPTDEANLKPTFIPRSRVEMEHPVVIPKSDVQHASFYVPKHNTYLATYFMITGLHGLHVLAGVIVFIYFFLQGRFGTLYKSNPEQLCNRVEVAGLFWHFVDLVWIFVFPIFYLL